MLQFEDQCGTGCLKNFNEALSIIRRRHLDTVPLMARAVMKLNNTALLTEGVNYTVQYFLNRLYTNRYKSLNKDTLYEKNNFIRISIHMLISHYAALCGQTKTVTGMVGTVDQECDLTQVARYNITLLIGNLHDHNIYRYAYEDAAQLCDTEYLSHPDLVITALDTTTKSDNVKCVYVPSHLHHIFFEIFKNSMRATNEFADERGLTEIPSIQCQIFKTVDDITIKVSDQGGGINRATRGKIFEYMFTTAPKVELPHGGGSYGAGLEGRNLPMHGLGYGLPLSRLYARYRKLDNLQGGLYFNL